MTTYDNKQYYQTSIASAQRTPTETYYQTGEFIQMIRSCDISHVHYGTIIEALRKSSCVGADEQFDSTSVPFRDIMVHPSFV